MAMRDMMQRLKLTVNELLSRLPAFIRPEALVYQVNQVLRGWANYFCFGTYTSAFHVVHRHAYRRVRRWLRRKLELDGQGVSQFPDSRLEREFGLLNLDRFPRRHSWAKSRTFSDPFSASPFPLRR